MLARKSTRNKPITYFIIMYEAWRDRGCAACAFGPAVIAASMRRNHELQPRVMRPLLHSIAHRTRLDVTLANHSHSCSAASVDAAAAGDGPSIASLRVRIHAAHTTQLQQLLVHVCALVALCRSYTVLYVVRCFRFLRHSMRRIPDLPAAALFPDPWPWPSVGCNVMPCFCRLLPTTVDFLRSL